jgi:Pectic acid lyase
MSFLSKLIPCLGFAVFISTASAEKNKAKPETTKAPAQEGKSEAKAEAKTKPLPTYPAPADVIAAMKKAASYYRSQVAFAGGYAWRWPTDMSIAKGEDHESPTLIMMQPPGTPAIGMAMLTAFKNTGDPLFLQGAKEAAQALMWCQLASGGWDSDFDFDPRKAAKYHFRRDIEAGDTERGKRHASSTLDDDKTESALLFLLELAHTDTCKNDATLQAAVKFGFDGLLAAQAPNGAWGQHFSGPADPTAPVTKAKLPVEWPHIWPGVDYTGFYTLNDGNLLRVMHLLLRAYELDKNESYLAAARRLGDFLLLAQLPEPQPAWAQQYNRDMEPVWARKFEPPAVSSLESATAINALMELWVVTGDEKYTKPIAPAMAWLERSKLPEGVWARFYELGTNKPLYCKAETYEVTFDGSNTPTHYGFKTEEKFAETLTKMKDMQAMSREAIQKKNAAPSDAKKWTSNAKGQAAKVNIALTAADKKTGIWMKSELIDAGEFVKAFKAMNAYVEAAKNGGALFEELRASVP